MLKEREDLTAELKQYARKMGADLVGIASVSRYKGAPSMLRPQAHLPEAKAVISMAVHHPDASVEWTGEPNPNYPASFQIGMIPKLDTLSFRVGKFLEKRGHATIPLPCTTYWRHRKYKDIPFEHAATFSHLNAFVAAGLGEYGWHGIVMSPQYGPRQRLISIITAADLVPDPLYTGESLCDQCMLCAKHCPGQNYGEDRLNDPAFIEFEIEGRTFKYPSINRWRCFYGEQAHLDMNELSQLDHMDEEKIYEAIENGVPVVNYGYACNSFKYCMAKPLREWDLQYSPGPRRKKQYIAKSNAELMDKIKSLAVAAGADHLAVQRLSDLQPEKSNFHEGFRTDAFLDTYQTVITIGRPVNCYDSFGPLGPRNQKHLLAAMTDRISSGIIDISRYLDDLGHDAIQDWNMTGITQKALERAGWSKPGKQYIAMSVLCQTVLPQMRQKIKTWDEPCLPDIEINTDMMRNIEKISACSLAVIDQENINCFKQAHPGYKSIVALAISLPTRLTELAGQQEAEDCSAYAFMHYQIHKEALWAAQDLCDTLEHHGYRAVALADLTTDPHLTIGKFGRHMPDLRSNAAAAAAAGLGEIGRSGLLLTPEHGPRLRYVFVLTEAELTANPPAWHSLCPEDCQLCAQACPTQALDPALIDQIKVRTDQVAKYKVMRLNDVHCAWARSLAMTQGAGSAQLGWKLPDLPVPDELTDELIARAQAGKDPIQRICYRNPHFTDLIVERCLQACPIGKSSSSQS